MKIILALVAAATLGTAATAANLVTNGGFESSTYTSNNQFGSTYGGQGVTGWTGAGVNHLQFYYFGGTQTTTNATNQYGDPKAYFYPTFSTLSPNGGNFVGLDGDADFSGTISQTINGLTPGAAYTLKFSWAGSQLINRAGDTTDSLRVTFGTDTVSTAVVPVLSGQFSGWFNETFKFTATSTSQVLSFLSVGTPSGQPPIAALDGISLTGGVPEASTWVMMIAGFGLVGVAARRRRSMVAA